MNRLAMVAVVAAALALAACSEGAGDQDTADRSAVASPGGAAVSAVGPGISVSDALKSTLDGPLLVNGFLHVSDGQVRLCSALLESFPPQCGGDFLVVQGLDPSTVAGLKMEGGVSWTDQHIQLLGDVESGALTVSTTSLG